jgi:hypothetical protein
MFKPIFVGGCLAISLFLIPAIAYGQASSLTPAAPAEMATGDQITPLEVQQFVQVLKRWKDIDQESQKKILMAIKAERLNPQLFLEIAKTQNTQTEGSPEFSAADLQKFKKVISKIQAMEPEIQSKKEHAITSQGLTVARFNQIGYTSEQNPALKQKIKQMLGE